MASKWQYAFFAGIQPEAISPNVEYLELYNIVLGILEFTCSPCPHFRFVTVIE